MVSVYNKCAVCDKLFPTNHSTQDSEKFQFKADSLSLRLVHVIDQIVVQGRRDKVHNFSRRICQHCTNASLHAWRIRFKTCICEEEEHVRNWPMNSRPRPLRLQTWKIQLQSADGLNIQRRILWRVCMLSDNRQCLLSQPPKELARGKLKPAPESKRISTRKPSPFNDWTYHRRNLPSIETPRALTDPLKGGALSPDSANRQPNDFSMNLTEPSTDTCSLLSQKVTKSSK